MDKQTFSSIQATTNTSRYAAAVFRKGLVGYVRGFLVVSPYFPECQDGLHVAVFFLIAQ